MRKNKLTDYGKCIKKKLLDMDKSQEWLISEVNKKSPITLTSSYLNRIMIGKVINSTAIPIINEVLEIEQEAV